MITPQRAVERINERYGVHGGYRALHAKGTSCTGTFTATTAARDLTRAAHMQGQPVAATVRLSNGSGDPGSPDYAPDVRGLAVSFHLPDGSRTDISAQTAPRFPVRDPDAFIALVAASERGLGRLWKLPLFLATHLDALPALRAIEPATKPPASYATCRFYAIHAFRWENADRTDRYVRYTWLPEVAEQPLAVEEAKQRGRDYLQLDLGERLGRGPVRFTLELQLADPGDPVDDPTAVWPEERERIVAGTLDLEAVASDPEQEGDVQVFDPTRVTDGIDVSDDPILRFRPRAYWVSVERRT